jgi:tyrosyl-DNA phosphodiesterase 2
MSEAKNPYGYTNEPFNYEVTIAETIINKPTEPNDPKSDHPKKFKIATYNLWGVERFTFTFIDERAPFIIRSIKKLDADVYCLQEVGPKLFTHLQNDDFITKNYHFSDVHVNWSQRDVICLTLTKQIPIQTATYRLKGGLFHSDIIVVTFDDKIVINLNLHPGSKYSPGVVKTDCYMFCRIEQIKILKQIMSKLDQKSKSVYLCGDFNIDLDGHSSEWPELIFLKNISLIDTWTELKKDDPGFTENTTINEMRWNTKQISKHVRFDGIFYIPNSSTKSASINLFGTEAVFKIPFSKFATIANNLKLDFKKGFVFDGKMGYNDQDLDHVNWYSSDHFGVVAEFDQ